MLIKAESVSVYRNVHQGETVESHGPMGQSALNPEVSTHRKSLTNKLHLKIWETEKEFSDPTKPNTFSNPLTVSRQLLKAEPGTPVTESVDVQVRKADNTVVTERHALPGQMVTTTDAKLLWKSDRDLLSNSRAIGEFPLHKLKRVTHYTKETLTDKDNKPLPANLAPGMLLIDSVTTTEEGFIIPENDTPAVAESFERCASCYRAKVQGKPCIVCGYNGKRKSYNPIP